MAKDQLLYMVQPNSEPEFNPNDWFSSYSLFQIDIPFPN